MKEFIEKLIGRLEEEKRRLRSLKNDCISLCDREVIEIEEKAYNFCKEIVNQLAEEFADKEVLSMAEITANHSKAVLEELKLIRNGGWIPVSERLPEDCTIYEVTARFGNGMCYTEFAYYDESKGEWWKHDDDGLVNVIAWKEHSEPYQPKGE